jgi:histidyl-tRNA synthetase
MACSPTDFLKISHQTAAHFGFKSGEQLEKEPACKSPTVTLPHSIDHTRLDAHHGILYEALATYCDKNLHSPGIPVLLYRHHEPIVGNDVAVSFSIFNVEKSIAEAILIHVSRALLCDLGYPDHIIRINALGDTESVTRYSREIGNFLKRRLDSLPVEARERLKEHPLSALTYLIESGHDLAYRSPNPLEYLSDQSRKHFREIIEYLDMSNTPYEIDPKLLGHYEYAADALFSVDFSTPSVPLTVRGGRTGELTYRSTKTRTPTSSVVVTLKNARLPARVPRAKNTVPSVYVVQLGFGPKIRSLMLIDALRQNGITVRHDLTSDSLSAQLRDAEARGVRYTVIVGQKEFVEQTVILRDMSARNQEPVPLDQLIRKLKRHTAALR